MDFPRSTGEQDENAPGQVIAFPAQAEPVATAAPAAANTASPQPPAPSGVHLWVRRLQLVVFVLFCVQVGMFLVVLPWTRLWTENGFLNGYPQLKELMNTGFVRGMATGFGLLDIFLGIREAVLYSEPKA